MLRTNSGHDIELRDLNHREPESPPTHEFDSENDLYPTNMSLVLTTAGLVLSIFLAALHSKIIAQAIPGLADRFGSIANIAWCGTSYRVSNTAFNSAWGKAYTYFALKPTYLTAMAIFELGNVVFGSAQSSNAVILGRVISGLGGAGVMSESFVIIALTVKPHVRAAYMGVLGATFGYSSVIGPLLGSTLVNALSWRWCFWINLPIGAVAAGTILFSFAQHRTVVPPQISLKEKIANMDVNGRVLVAGALSCWVLAMHWAGIYTWTSARVIGSLAGSAGMTASIFRCSTLCPFSFKSINNESAVKSGIRLIPLVLGISACSLISNVILIWWRHYNPLIVAGALAGTLGVSIIYTFDEHTPLAKWIGLEILADAVGLEDISVAISISLFAENVGTTLFVVAAEAAFMRGLISGATNLPGIDPIEVVNTGATQLRSSFPPSKLRSVLVAYLEGCRDSHIIPIACGSAAAFLSLITASPSVKKGFQTWANKPLTG